MVDVSGLNFKQRQQAQQTQAEPTMHLPYEDIDPLVYQWPQVGADGDAVAGADPYTFDDSGIGGMPPGYFPEEYGEAEEFYRMLMGGGLNVGTPGYWDTGGQALTSMARGGQPVDIQGYAESLIPVTDRAFRNQAAAAMEKYGLGGVRDSSIAEYGLEDISGRLQENVHMATQMQWLQAQEAAKARILQATNQLYNYGQGQVGLGLANVGNQMQGVGGLMGLGQEYLYAPLQIGQGMFGLGQGYMGAQQGMYDAEANDPYLAMALQMANINSPQYMPNQYTPGFGTQMMNIGGAAQNYMDARGWGKGGGGGMWETQAPAGRYNQYDYQDILNQAPGGMQDRYYGGY